MNDREIQRAWMLLEIFHKTIQIPQLNELHKAAMDELLAIQEHMYEAEVRPTAEQPLDEELNNDNE